MGALLAVALLICQHAESWHFAPKLSAALTRKDVLRHLIVSAPLVVAGSAALAEEKNVLHDASEVADKTRPLGQPTPEQTRVAQDAFAAFNRRDLPNAERLFTRAIDIWTDINRPLDEIATLYKARGSVRVDLKKFDAALEDFNSVLERMRKDGAEKSDGTARYSEYPDTYVQRGLTYEGLADWEAAIADYTKAVALWGGGRGEGINPFVLTFRGNALARLGKYAPAIDDYTAAENLFLTQRDEERATDVRANLALALYGAGKTEQSEALMRAVVRRVPGYADMHIALAANAWGKKDAVTAEKEWEFACSRIDVGCRKYRDEEWVTTVRRWPPSLARKLKAFLDRKADVPT